MPETRKQFNDALALIFEGIDQLTKVFPKRAFTIDGRLVGDVGEAIAAFEYELTLDEVQQPIHDATSKDGRRIQIKATFKNSLTFRQCPDYYLGFKLHPNGDHEEIFNGPGRVILERYKSRKGIGVDLLSFPISELRQLSEAIPADQRIARRNTGEVIS